MQLSAFKLDHAVLLFLAAYMYTCFPFLPCITEHIRKRNKALHVATVQVHFLLTDWLCYYHLANNL